MAHAHLHDHGHRVVFSIVLDTDPRLLEVRRNSEWFNRMPVAVLGDDAARGGRIARDAKLALAAAVVERYHGAVAAEKARVEFLDIFAHGAVPEELEQVSVEHRTPTALALLEQVRPDLSRSALRRLISQDAVRIDGVPVTDPEQEVLVSSGSVVRTGRRSWARVALR